MSLLWSNWATFYSNTYSNCALDWQLSSHYVCPDCKVKMWLHWLQVKIEFQIFPHKDGVLRIDFVGMGKCFHCAIANCVKVFDNFIKLIHKIFRQIFVKLSPANLESHDPDVNLVPRQWFQNLEKLNYLKQSIKFLICKANIQGLMKSPVQSTVKGYWYSIVDFDWCEWTFM